MKETGKKRIIQAPFSGGLDQRGQVLNLTLDEGEEVIWQWTHRPDGTSAVTGFQIINKTEEKSERSER